MAYNADDFDADSVQDLLTSVREGTEDELNALSDLADSFRAIRSHLNYLLAGMANRIEELDDDDQEDEDANYDLQ